MTNPWKGVSKWQVLIEGIQASLLLSLIAGMFKLVQYKFFAHYTWKQIMYPAIFGIPFFIGIFVIMFVFEIFEKLKK